MERARKGRLGEVFVSLADTLADDDVIDLLYALTGATSPVRPTSPGSP